MTVYLFELGFGELCFVCARTTSSTNLNLRLLCPHTLAYFSVDVPFLFAAKERIPIVCLRFSTTFVFENLPASQHLDRPPHLLQEERGRHRPTYKTSGQLLTFVLRMCPDTRTGLAPATPPPCDNRISRLCIGMRSICSWAMPVLLERISCTSRPNDNAKKRLERQLHPHQRHPYDGHHCRGRHCDTWVTKARSRSPQKSSTRAGQQANKAKLPTPFQAQLGPPKVL